MARERRQLRKTPTRKRFTTLLMDDILEAAERAHPEGRIGYLTEQARLNPNAFMSLLGRVLPHQIVGAGEDGEHLLKVQADEAFTKMAALLDGHAAMAKGADREED